MVSIKHNLNGIDRLARSFVGIGCIYFGFIDSSYIGDLYLAVAVGIFGVMNLIAAAVGSCPVYAVGGISTCAVETLQDEWVGVRRRLVAGFVSVAVFVLLLYGSVAHRMAVNVGFSEQLSLLHDIAEGEAAALNLKPSADLTVLLNSDFDAEFESAVVTLEPGGVTEISRVRGDIQDKLPLAEINAILAEEKDRGVSMLNGEKVLWALTRIPYSEQFLLLFYHNPANRLGLDYESRLEALLVVIAFIIIWVAIWVALVLSKRIVLRLDEQSKALLYQATHDELTNLPNRTSLFKAVSRCIDEDDEGNGFSVLVLDINRFKEVNDTIGHDNGDRLLQQLAERFEESLTAVSEVYRLGGDEFAILQREPQRQVIKKLVINIVHMLSNPFTLEEIDLHIDVSIGAATYPKDADDANTLIKLAEVAMYQAKTQSSTFLAYEVSYDPYSVQRLTLMSELRGAIDDQIVLYYQPKVDLALQKTTSVEALVRWLHPQHGLIPPDEFISIAENSGMMNALTLRIIEIAMAQSHMWFKQGLAIQVSVNLSVINLLDENLPQQVQTLLNIYQLEPKYLKFEITESSLMSDPERALATLQALDEMQITLSIDDFGTGYSSLSYLKKLPVSELKIDRVFVSDMMGDEDDKVIVKSTIELAHNMSCSVVAEGVEDQNSYNYLIELGCDMAQGYYLSRPLPAAELAQWFECGQWPPVRRGVV